MPKTLYSMLGIRKRSSKPGDLLSAFNKERSKGNVKTREYEAKQKAKQKAKPTSKASSSSKKGY